jgi:hypothetical protein
MRIYFTISQADELSGLDKKERLRRERLVLTVTKVNHPYLVRLPVLFCIVGAIVALFVSPEIVRFLSEETAKQGERVVLDGLWRIAVVLCGGAIGGLIGLQILVARIRTALRQLFGK